MQGPFDGLQAGGGGGRKAGMGVNESMQAAVFLGDRTIEVQSLDVPQPGPDEVLLKVEACGVCGTDHHIFAGELTEGVQPPVVLGHEIAARVAAVGKGVTGLAEGQFCSVDPVLGCGHCPRCASGLHNLCPAPEVIGYKLSGGFAQYLIAPVGKVVAMDEAVGPAGGVLCETLACVLRGYDRLAFAAGSNALILGAGTVGLLWTQLVKSSPAGRILQSEAVAMRRGKAETLGADVAIDPADGLAAAVRAELREGADYIIDATGDPEAIQEAVDLLAPGGTFMMFGVCPAGATIEVEPHEMFRKEATILGSKMPPGTLHRSARLIESGRIACEEIVTTTRGLAETADLVAGFSEHRDAHVKIAIDPWME